jgi:hypothetical protein
MGLFHQLSIALVQFFKQYGAIERNADQNAEVTDDPDIFQVCFEYTKAHELITLV